MKQILVAIAFGLAAMGWGQGLAGPSNYIVGKFSVNKSRDSEKNFANTGLAYDTKRNILLIGNCYNNLIEFYDKTGKRVKPALNVAHLGVRGLQGVAYDTSDDSIWVWATAQAAGETNRNMIWHCDINGSQIEEPFEFSPTPGMISYDKTTDSLWARSYDWNNGSLYRIACATKKVEETLKPGEGVGYAEGVGYDPFDGTFWLLGRSSLFHAKKVGAKYELIEKYPNPSANCPEDCAVLEKLGKPATVKGADEGVAVDPTDHTIWINTDTDKGANRIPGCNRCWHLNPLGLKD